MPRTKDDRNYSWTFTDYDVSEENKANYKKLESHARRLIIGEETCPTTGRPHLQGYVRFKNSQYFSFLKRRFPKAHIDQAKGNDSENEVYCTKESTFINFGFNKEGTPPKEGEKPVDQVIRMIEDGARYGDIRASQKRFCFYNRNNILHYMHDERRLKEDPDFDPSKAFDPAQAYKKMGDSWRGIPDE